MSGTSSDVLGRVVESGGGVLLRLSGVHGLAGDEEVVLSSESLLALRLGLGHLEADGVVVSESLGGSVVHAGEVHWVQGEALVSSLGTGLLSLEGTVFSSKSPEDAGRLSHT